MSFDKSNFDTTTYTDENYPRTQTDKQRVDSGKMVPIPSALVQIVNSEDYRLGFKFFRLILNFKTNEIIENRNSLFCEQNVFNLNRY